MTQAFQDELDKLKKELYGMSGMVVVAIDRAIDAFIEHDPVVAQEVIDGDKDIDLRENTVDGLCMNLLALQQPYADDFRVIITAIKAAHSLERMGDHAKALGKAVVADSAGGGFHMPAGLRTMARVVPDMVHGCVRALQLSDPELAEQVRRQDSEVNEAYDVVLRDYATYIEQNPSDSYRAIRLVEATKHLERCADLAKNICKDVIFVAEGRNVRHGGQSDADREE